MSRTMRLSEAVQVFLSTCGADRSPHTVRAYTTDLAQFCSRIGPDFELGAIGLAQTEEWFDDLASSGYAAASRRRKLATLRCFFKYWVRRRVLSSSPLSEASLRIPVPVRLPRALELEEARALLRTVRTISAAAPQDLVALRNRTIVEILLSTGIRVGELVRIRLKDYRADQPALMIHGKGSRERLAFLLDSDSRESLEALRDAILASHGPGHALFVNARGGALTEQGVAHVLRRVCVAAGISRRVTPHMLRHTAASLLLYNGADIRLVQDFLGHTSIATTQIYTQLAPALLRQALERVHHSRLLSS